VSTSVYVGIVTSVALSVFLGASQTNSDRPRETAEKIAELLAALEATPGKVIADVGAGEGFYTIRIAQAVAPNGRVTAVDVNQKVLDTLRERLNAEKIANVDVVLGAFDDPRLAAATYDAVLVYNTYHEMTEHAAMRRAMFAALKPGARLVVAEGISENIRTASREVQVKDHEIALEYVAQELTDTGFHVIETRPQFFSYLDPQHKGGFWLIVARKPA
jgi:ubiquinone/menaquinone biosynthesis C-methylase UbiE